MYAVHFCGKKCSLRQRKRAVYVIHAGGKRKEVYAIHAGRRKNAVFAEGKEQSKPFMPVVKNAVYAEEQSMPFMSAEENCVYAKGKEQSMLFMQAVENAVYFQCARTFSSMAFTSGLRSKLGASLSRYFRQIKHNP